MTITFEKQPHLIGQQLELRPLHKEDFAALYACAADPLIWQGHPNKNQYQQLVFEVWFAKALACKGALLIIDRNNNQVIGSSRYYQFDACAKQIAIGFTFLARAYWGGASNFELKKLMLDHAFRFVDQVVFYIAPTNHRSQQAITKVGALFSHHEYKQTAQGEQRYYCFKITNSDWRSASGEKH